MRSDLGLIVEGNSSCAYGTHPILGWATRGIFFFTVVTDRRRPIFDDAHARKILGSVFRECRVQWDFEVRAIVLLPDHLHAIWSLPRGDREYSKRWAWIKSQFTKRWLKAGGAEAQQTPGRKRDGRRGVWQPKF